SANEDLAARVAPRIMARGGNSDAVDLPAVMGLLKDRSETLEQLADGAMLFCAPYQAASAELQAEVLTTDARVLLAEFAARAAELADWSQDTLDTLIKAMLQDHGIKMHRLAIPLRVAVTGVKHTPSIG